MPRCPDTIQAPIFIGQVDSRNGHAADEAGLAERLRTTREMAIDGRANDPESQINIVDCSVNVYNGRSNDVFISSRRQNAGNDILPLGFVTQLKTYIHSKAIVDS